MTKIGDITLEELELLIEQKVLEFLGDPDAGLELTQEFKDELSRRLKSSHRQVSHRKDARGE